MWTFISVILALGINFYIPEIPENKKSMVINENYYQRIGFPYQYFPGELLTDQQVKYRIQLIYVSFMMYLMLASSLGPILTPVLGHVLLPLPVTSIERVQPNTLDLINKQARHIPKPASVSKVRPNKIELTYQQIEQLDLRIKKCMDGSISVEETILQLRAGDLAEWVAKFGIAMAIITVLNNVDAFQVPPGTIPPPHLAWLYGNQQPGNNFGYGKEAGPRSITIVGATKNAGSEKKEPSNGSVEVVSLIEKDSRLAKEAAIMGKNQDVQREANHLLEQLSKGNFNPGTQTKNLFKDICYLRGDKGARIFYRIRNGVVEILGKSSKANETKVIKILTKMYK